MRRPPDIDSLVQECLTEAWQRESDIVTYVRRFHAAQRPLIVAVLMKEHAKGRAAVMTPPDGSERCFCRMPVRRAAA